jgi:hypothetical protein
MTEEQNTDEDDEDDDDDFSFTSELSGGLSTTSKIDAAKSLMADSEKSLYESLDDDAKLEFLQRKKEENIRIVCPLPPSSLTHSPWLFLRFETVVKLFKVCFQTHRVCSLILTAKIS